MFRVGDVVRLESGGPKMTVTDVGNNSSGQPTVWTTWFDGTQKLDGYFPVDAVETA